MVAFFEPRVICLIVRIYTMRRLLLDNLVALNVLLGSKKTRGQKLIIRSNSSKSLQKGSR